MNFPNIDYEFWFSYWGESIGKMPVYSNKNMKPYIKFKNDINSCTQEIYELTKKEEPTKEVVLRVVDLIYSWGGRSGRMFYSSNKKRNCPREILENDEMTFTTYLNGLKSAQKGQSESISIFRSIIGIGASYASKHSYFWSLNSEKPLIIVDSKIAGALGFRSIEILERSSSYSETVHSFTKQALLVFKEKNPSKIERALFAFHNFYFLNDNSGWKNKTEYKDFVEAERIAKYLFE